METDFFLLVNLFDLAAVLRHPCGGCGTTPAMDWRGVAARESGGCTSFYSPLRRLSQTVIGPSPARAWSLPLGTELFGFVTVKVPGLSALCCIGVDLLGFGARKLEN